MIQHFIQPPSDLSTLPDPPVPADLDLRHFDCMHLNTVDLLESPIWDECSDAAIAVALRLWAKAWQQVPCSSLPNDVKKIREWAGCLGRPKRWKSVQKDGLRGFILCNDGRLYHHKVAESASNAASRSRAGKRGAKAKWDKVNELKNHKTGDAVASGKHDGMSNGRSDGTVHGRSDGKADGKTMQRREGNTLPPYPPLCSARSGSLEAPSARPPQPPDAGPVEITMPTGARIKISRSGQVDEVWAPRDCPTTEMTRAEAIELRRKALNPDAPSEPQRINLPTNASAALAPETPSEGITVAASFVATKSAETFDPERDMPDFMRRKPVTAA